MDRLRHGSALRLAFALGWLASAAPAQAQVPWNPRAPENNQVRPSFNYATVEEVLNAIGARHERSGTSPARPLIVVTFANGRRAVLSLSLSTYSYIYNTIIPPLFLSSLWSTINVSLSLRATFLGSAGFAFQGVILGTGHPCKFSSVTYSFHVSLSVCFFGLLCFMVFFFFCILLEKSKSCF